MILLRPAEKTWVIMRHFHRSFCAMMHPKSWPETTPTNHCYVECHTNDSQLLSLDLREEGKIGDIGLVKGLDSLIYLNEKMSKLFSSTVGLQLTKTFGSRVGFLRRGLITATLKHCGRCPVSQERFKISSKDVLFKGKTSLNSLVRIGCKRQVEDFDLKIVEACIQGSYISGRVGTG